MKLYRETRSSVRVAAMSAALLLMLLYASFSSKGTRPNDSLSGLSDALGRRRLLQHNNESEENLHCDHPMDKNNSCEYVKANCSDDVNLVNYLSLIACDMSRVKASRPSHIWGEGRETSAL